MAHQIRINREIDFKFAMSIPVPAYCPKCKSFFDSPFVIGPGQSVSFFGGGAIESCPKGHTGHILDGTYSVGQGLMNIALGNHGRKADLEKIHQIAEDASDADPETQKGALDKISEYLPEVSRAAIKQLAADKPASAILNIIIRMLEAIVLFGVAYDTYFSPDPPPTTVINNNNTTIIYEAAPGDQRNDGITKPLKREQKRRMRQMQRKDDKLEHEEEEQKDTDERP